MADAYSSAKTTALDSGDYRATRNRATGLLKKVDEWVSKAYILAQAGRGDNFDLSAHGITHILPVVVTAAVEWLPDDSAKLWLDEETPRVVSIVELIKYVERLDPVALRAISVPVVRSR